MSGFSFGQHCHGCDTVHRVTGREETWLPQGTVPTGGGSEGTSLYLKDGGTYIPNMANEVRGSSDKEHY